MGAHFGPLRTQGLWSPEELLLHIIVRELRVVCLACQAFQPHLEGNCMLVLTDNMTAMFYIKGRTEHAPLPCARKLLSCGNSA